MDTFSGAQRLKSNKYYEKIMYVPIENHPLFKDFQKTTKRKRPRQAVQTKPMVVGENAWKGNVSKGKLDEIVSNVTSILNKLTPEKYDLLIKQFFEIDLTEKEVLEKVVDIIYKKAIYEPVFSKMYSKLCKDIYNHANEKSFKFLLIKKCNESFKARGDDIKSKANIVFIGELSNVKFIEFKYIKTIMKTLLKKEPASIELLCKLIVVVGKKVEKVDYPLFKTLKEYEKDKEIKIRYRFMITDIFDLKKVNWKKN